MVIGSIAVGGSQPRPPRHPLGGMTRTPPPIFPTCSPRSSSRSSTCGWLRSATSTRPVTPPGSTAGPTAGNGARAPHGRRYEKTAPRRCLPRPVSHRIQPCSHPARSRLWLLASGYEGQKRRTRSMSPSLGLCHDQSVVFFQPIHSGVPSWSLNRKTSFARFTVVASMKGSPRTVTREPVTVTLSPIVKRFACSKPLM